jgi:hypothetical protein
MALPVFDLEPEYAALADMPLEAPADDDGGLNVEAALDALREEIAPKLLALAKVIRTLEAEADLLEEHARALNARANSRRRRVDFLKRWTKLQMEAAGIEKVKDAFVNMWLQVSPPSVKVVDEAAVPPQFQRAVLRLPYSLVPSELRGFLQHLDVERSAILDLSKRTGEVPPGIVIKTGERHVRIR